MMGWKLRITRWRCAPVIVIVLIASSARSQVRTDGSMGPVVSLSGNMVIGNSMGTQVGANLFHSFSVFNIQTGESAKFTSTFSGATNNIIARITGNTSSWIDGTLGSSIPGADLWLINPNGLAFGKNASLDVRGSFHASTADYVKFEDGKQFAARVPTGVEILSVANPSAFGFLVQNPASISLNGTKLQVPTGKSISLAAGGIDLAAGTLQAWSGRIDLVSVASAGEASLNSAGAFDVASFASLGDISLSNGSKLDAGSYSGAGGSIFIRGGRFYMNNARIQNSTGMEDGGPIDISTTGDIGIGGNSEISTDTYDTGRAGDIRLETAGDATVSDGSWIFSTASSDYAFGNSGDIAVDARNVSIANQGRIFTSAENYAVGNAGTVAVNASDTITISGDPGDFGTGIASASYFSYGNAGAVTLDSKNLIMNGGTVSSESVYSMGTAGDVSVNVAALELSGEAILSASNRGFASGGNLTVTASDHVSLASESVIQATTRYSGPGGTIRIDAPNLIIDHAKVETATYGSGNAGDIQINTGELTLSSGFINSDAQIFSSGAAGNISIAAKESIFLENTGLELDRPRISSTSLGDGDAGSITISSPTIVLVDGSIETNTLLGAGNAGTIQIDTGELLLKTGGNISTDAGESATGHGGAIAINASDSIALLGISPTSEGFRSGISASTVGIGDGGSITIDTPQLDLDGGSISAATGFDQGNAGDINISTGSLRIANEGNIQVASNGMGAGGNLQIQASSITIDGSTQGIYGTGIVSDAYGSGDGGNLRIITDWLDLINGGRISARSKGTGKAGALALDVANILRLTNSSIQTSSDLSAGGNVEIQVGGQLQLWDSSISSSADGVTQLDDGGNLTARTPQFMLLSNSSILARANAGNGGNITLGADYFLPSAKSTVSATSQKGLDGKIVIDSPNQIRGTVALLAVPAIDIAALLRERCAAAALRGQSSFTIEGLSGIPQRPGDFLTSPGICFVPKKTDISDSSNVTSSTSKKASKEVN